jgi:hypothetical protein
MKINFLLSLPVIGSLALVSCYPIGDGPRRPRGSDAKPPENQTVTSQEQQKIEEQRERMKELEKKEKEELVNGIKEKNEETIPTSPKPPEPKNKDYAFANPVPGKEGFVFSPYNQKLVDVRDIPSGTLVQDPTYPASEKKYFRVP